MKVDLPLNKETKPILSVLKTKNSDYNTLHMETPLLHPHFLHSDINQYGHLFTSSPCKTLSLLESIRGDNLHGLTF